jgi:oxygen-dependent protoporphyrinogen oxidase
VTSHEVVVVGAGLAGLTAGWTLRDRDVLVLEATDRVGGRLYSEPRGPYWLNLGAHLFGGPGTLLDRLVGEMGLETRPVPGNRMGLAWRGRLVTGRPATYPLRLRAAARGYLRAARPRPAESPAETRARLLAYRDDQTFAAYLGELHPEVAGIFRAIAERVAAEPEEISAGCGAALFALLWGGRETLARNLIGGSALLPQALARRLGERVVTGAIVEEVAPVADSLRVRFLRDGARQEVTAACAIVATPAPVTAAIVRDVPPDTAAALAGLPYGAFVCGAFLTDEPGPMPWDHVYAVAVAGRSFNMLFNHANPLRGPGKREPGGSLMVYGGGQLGRDLLPLGDDEIRARFQRDLHALLPGTRGIAREVLVQRWAHAIPYVAPGRARMQAALTRPLGRVFLAGDYLEFPDMEAAAVTGLEAAREIRRRLGAP